MSKNTLRFLSVVVVMLSGATGASWAGCWACEQVGTSPVTCASKFLSGGTSCELKCSDRLGGSYCICKTSGVCEGGRGCEGPCPNSEVSDNAVVSDSEIRSAVVRQALEAQREQELSRPRPAVRFPETLLSGVGDAHPLAASILESLTTDGRLSAGEFKGLLSITPTDGSQRPIEVYSFEAQVVPSPAPESFAISIVLVDHPEIERVTGTISRQDGQSEVLIHGMRGGVEAFQER